MNSSLNLRTLFAPSNIRTLAGPLLIILVLSMMVLPLPAFVLDLMFTFNIAVSVMVMLVAMYTKKPLDFSVFPTVLLVTTLLRLSLNVASTRIVLLEGHTGPDAAGKVIEAFGHFLVGGNTAVGLVVFIILTVINFVVITKGAGRIAEVGARFTLDAMPGKQMAIDADLNAGLLTREEAKLRRVGHQDFSFTPGIDITDAWEVDGVEAIYTFEDLDELMARPLPVLIPHPALTHPRTCLALADTEVNHVGEPVVMVVARDRYVAEDAAARIVVSYETKPVVVGVAAAREAALAVHDDVPDNVAAHLIQEVGDVDAALACSPHRLTIPLTIERSACMPMEGKGVLARWDRDEQSMRMWSSTQTSTGVRAAVAAAALAGPRHTPVVVPSHSMPSASSATASETATMTTVTLSWAPSAWAPATSAATASGSAFCNGRCAGSTRSKN